MWAGGKQDCGPQQTSGAPHSRPARAGRPRDARLRRPARHLRRHHRGVEAPCAGATSRAGARSGGGQRGGERCASRTVAAPGRSRERGPDLGCATGVRAAEIPAGGGREAGGDPAGGGGRGGPNGRSAGQGAAAQATEGGRKSRHHRHLGGSHGEAQCPRRRWRPDGQIPAWKAASREGITRSGRRAAGLQRHRTGGRRGTCPGVTPQPGEERSWGEPSPRLRSGQALRRTAPPRPPSRALSIGGSRRA